MANPGSPKTIYTGAPSNKGLVVQGTVNQSANLQEWQVSAGTPVSYVDPSSNLVGPSNGSSDPTLFASTRHLMAAGRYHLAPFSTNLQTLGGPDFLAATFKSDVSQVQSARNVMWQFFDSEVQNTSDRATVNFNVVQRYNTIGSVALTQPGSNYTAPPTLIILNDPGWAVSLSSSGCGYTNPPPADRRRARGRRPRIPPTEVFVLPDSFSGPEANERCDGCGLVNPLAGPVNRAVREGHGRLALVCLACYEQLEAEVGGGDSAARAANRSALARGMKWTWITAAKYQAFRQYLAGKLGLVAPERHSASAGHPTPE